MQQREGAIYCLQQGIEYSLSNNLLDNAVFLAERLYASLANAQSEHILATSYIRNLEFNRAYHLLSKNVLCTFSKSKLNRIHESMLHFHELNCYLYALCCFRLSKLKEAHFVLLNKSVQKTNSNNKYSSVPNGAAGLSLAGDVCRKLGLRKQALSCYKHAISLNPLLFSAYQSMCELGEDIEASTLFDIKNIDIQTTTESLSNVKQANTQTNTKQTNASKSEVAQKVNLLSTPFFSCGTLGTVGNESSNNTGKEQDTLSTKQTIPITVAVTPSPSPFKLAPRGVIDIPSIALPSPYKPTNNNNNNNTKNITREHFKTPLFDASSALTPSLARESELTPAANTNKNKAKKGVPKREQHEREAKKKFGRNKVKTGPAKNLKFEAQESKPTEATKSTHLPTTSKTTKHKSVEISVEDLKVVLELLQILGNATRHKHKYRSKRAIATLKALPRDHINTPWALNLIARCYFELAEYPNAKKIFERIRELDPYCIEGMEIYSSVLWHLHKEVELSYLAHELVQHSRLKPQTWCAVGNCFSLQKDHSTALKFFKRAIQVDSLFTYAYTLSGYEFIANDELEKASVCFRNALQKDDNHYNAWYGLGMVYLRQEKYPAAELHFKSAITINPTNSVLYCYLGMVYQARNKAEEALQYFEKAVKVSSATNGIAKFKQATALVQLHRYKEALDVLTKLVDAEPKEAAIWLLLSKVYVAMDEPTKSLKALSTALDLDGKTATQIKPNLEHLDVAEDVDNSTTSTSTTTVTTPRPVEPSD